MIQLIGYADRLSAAPGETVRFMVSSHHEQPFEAQLVRIGVADFHPHGPGFEEEEIPSAADGRYPSRFQPTWLGSYARVPDAPALAGLDAFEVGVSIWPTTPAKGRQGLISQWDAERGAGFALLIDADGCAALELGDGQGGRKVVGTGRRLLERRWYHLRAGFDPGARRLWIAQEPVHPFAGGEDGGAAAIEAEPAAFVPARRPLLIAALDVEGADEAARAGCHYNGRLEAPALHRAGTTVAAWDFARDMTSQRIADLGPHGLHGALVNLPTRAVRGVHWDGAEMHWVHRPEHYAAIHFHDDDIYDCGWDVDVALEVPDGLRPGAYALRLRCAGDEDHIPFYVRAPRGRPQARALVLVPTFTYFAYCNNESRSLGERGHQRAREWGAWTGFPLANRDFGLSTYDYHNDGSGIGFSSRRRPNINLRPGYLAMFDARGSGQRHAPADSHLLHWLDVAGFEYDVATDEDLHHEGLDLLRPYRVVLTGSHPEYHTPETLDALQGYVDHGGRLMYLGGNGFYWKIATHPELPGVFELRRAEGGIRLWAAEPGEYYHQFDGSYGGLWRRNGRPPQRLAGVGFTAQGDFSASYYRRAPGSFDPRVAFAFEGIGADELIGDFGFHGGGAAGFELDRADVALGTPPHALVLATSEGHGEMFRLVNEEMLRQIPHRPREEVVRADMVFFETESGGAVWSTGSITYCGSLLYNSGRNNVARITANVLRRFLDETPFTC